MVEGCVSTHLTFFTSAFTPVHSTQLPSTHARVACTTLHVAWYTFPSSQSREAANMLSAMAGDEGPRLVLYTFGVGRGVDDHELHFLASMTQGGQPEGPSSGEDSGSPSAARGSPLAARGPFAVAMPMSGASSNSSSSTVEPWSPKAATGPLQRCFMLRVMEDSW